MKNKKWFSLSEFSEKILSLLQRMPASVSIVIGFAVLCFICIHSDTDVSPRCIAFCVVGLFISIAAVLWLEDYVKNNGFRQLITLLCIVLWGAYCLTLPATEDWWNRVDVLPVIALGITFLAAIFFIGFLKDNEDKAYWEFSRRVIFQIAIAGVFSVILFAGLLLAIKAIQFLFNVDIDDKTYADLAVFCFALFAPLYALSGIPAEFAKHHATPQFNKVLKILGLYILLPLLAVYAVILYAYLIKIIVQWELPNGYVSWLVSALSLGGLAVITVLYPMYWEKEDNRIRWILRNFGLLVLPLLVLMTIGILRRIHDQGISINRCYILLLNSWFYGIFIYLYLSRIRKIKWIAVSATLIFLWTSVGPWRISNMVKNIMTKKLETVFKGRQLSLTAANTWFDQTSIAEKITVKKNLTYLFDNYDSKSVAPFFKENIENADWYNKVLPILNVDTSNNSNASNDSTYRDFNAEDNNQINIQGYRSCINFSWSSYQDKDTTNSIQCEVRTDSLVIQNISEKRSFGFPLKPTVAHLTGDEDSPIVLKARDCMLLLQNLSADYDNKKDTVNIRSVNGMLFYK